MFNINDKPKFNKYKNSSIGKSLIGKTALKYRFINDKFLTTIEDTTIEEQYLFQTKINEIKCKLEIVDKAGQDDYQTMLDTLILSADGFI